MLRDKHDSHLENRSLNCYRSNEERRVWGKVWILNWGTESLQK